MCEHHHKHTHHHGHGHGHGHHHHSNVQILGKHTELYFAILAGVFVVVGYGLSLFPIAKSYVIVCYVIAFFFGGFFSVQEAFTKLLKGKFEIDFLMFVAACGAAYLNKWVEGALLLFLFSLGHALEHYALQKAQKAISALGDLTPSVALVKQDDKFVEKPIENLKIGDIILVKAHQKIAADGVVISGQSSVNQAAITGESMPVDKFANTDYNSNSFDEIDAAHKVFAGTLNGGSPLEIKVLRIAAQSTVARMIEMVSKAQAKQSPTQHFTKRIEKYYVPAVLLLVIMLCFVFVSGVESFEESLYRAMSVLVASSPCALAISTPGTVLSGIARGAQKGILFKGGSALENLGSVSAIAFDKTGTLTEGKPQVVEVIPYNLEKTELLSLALSIESFSNHPLAVAIVQYANDFAERRIIEKRAINVVEGKGIAAVIDNENVKIGKLSFLSTTIPNIIQEKIVLFESKGYTLVGVATNTNFLGLIALIDQPKPTAANMLKNLRKQGIKKLLMLTGDQQSVAQTVGEALGIKEVRGGLLPEDKVAAIKELNTRYGKTAMIGDGVNDAPAMATSTVSIAMGAAGSDIALETADIALLSDNIRQIPFAVGLSRKAKQIIKQNLFISLSSIALLIPLAIFNITGIGATVILHEGTTILVILNALRLLGYKQISH